jgi:hypothetical protein
MILLGGSLVLDSAVNGGQFMHVMFSSVGRNYQSSYETAVDDLTGLSINHAAATLLPLRVSANYSTEVAVPVEIHVFMDWSLHSDVFGYINYKSLESVLATFPTAHISVLLPGTILLLTVSVTKPEGDGCRTFRS